MSNNKELENAVATIGDGLDALRHAMIKRFAACEAGLAEVYDLADAVESLRSRLEAIERRVPKAGRPKKY